MSRNFDKRVIRLLKNAGAVKDEALAQATEIAGKDKVSVSSVLVKKGLIEENDLLGLLAERLRVTPISLHDCLLDPEVVRVIPQDIATSHHMVPISRIEDVLTIAVSNPFDVVTLDQLRNTTGCDLRLVLSLEESIDRALTRVYNPGAAELEAVMDEMGDADLEIKRNEDIDELDLDAIAADDSESPVIKFVNLVIYQAIKERSSDIHIEPFEKVVRVRFRSDGVCHEAFKPPKALQNSIVSRVKIMCGMDIAERRKPQDGKFQIRVEGRQVDFRVSVLPTVHGEKVVMRILDAGNLALSLDSLGFEKKALDDFESAINSSYGMILVTGPTGSGKSTTLYSAVKAILNDELNFVTVEDPVEYQVFGVNQVHVNEKRGLTFASALRSILRQDPDIVMIGEIRDTETIGIAIKAALTGHLVLTTLHTNDAASTITRMIDMGVDPFMVASATLLVSAQRLARRLCKYCKAPLEKAPKKRLRTIGFTESELEDVEVFRPVGCPRCNNGYAGRFALLETMPMNDDVKRMVIEGKSSLELKNTAIRDHGMITLRRCGILNALRGITSLEEVLRVTMPDEVAPKEAAPKKEAGLKRARAAGR
ncbi:MAG: GspE/PulE family protein [Planctomycetota bacterium]|jgi:type IV pilus assembly protein PilB